MHILRSGGKVSKPWDNSLEMFGSHVLFQRLHAFPFLDEGQDSGIVYILVQLVVDATFIIFTVASTSSCASAIKSAIFSVLTIFLQLL
jgi:hypothetical protein